MRTAYLTFAGLTLLLVVAQFLTAGFFIFNATDSIDAHGAGAGVLHLTPLLMLISAAVGRLGRAAISLALVILVLVVVQSILPDAADEIAALHPLLALVIFMAAHQALQRGRAVPAAPTI